VWWKQVRELVDELGRGLGQHARKWVYSYLMNDREKCILILGKNTSSIEALFLAWIYPALKTQMLKALGLSEAAKVASLEACQEVLDMISKKLSDGRKYIMGNQFTAADITFGQSLSLAPRTHGMFLWVHDGCVGRTSPPAALAYPLVAPPELEEVVSPLSPDPGRVAMACS
jgi:glutathione S-transferase